MSRKPSANPFELTPPPVGAGACEYCHRSINRRVAQRDAARFCSRKCAALMRSALKPKVQRCPRKAAITRACLICGKETRNRVTCSNACRYVRVSQALRGKKYQLRVYSSTCAECGSVFTVTRRVKNPRCLKCVRRSTRKHESRARHAGVVYVSGIKPAEVFARDGWRCQLCRCRTPKRLRGTTQPNAPELDHILPIGAGGGHTWDNVQCACRKCNSLKSAKPLGQLRMDLPVTLKHKTRGGR